jgi:hypothetical protein
LAVPLNVLEENDVVKLSWLITADVSVTVSGRVAVTPENVAVITADVGKAPISTPLDTVIPDDDEEMDE